MDHRAIRTDGPDIDDLQLSAADLLAEDIGEAVVDLGDGRLTRARRRLGALWAQAAPGSAHRSAVAHWLGAVEDDVGAKVGWDERALEAAEAAEDWSVPFAGTGMTLGAMYPELHLELARGYRRLGSSCGALEHLALARNAVEMSGQTGRRDWLEQQIGGLEREVGGLQERGATPEWGFDDEDEPELADLWDDEGTD